MSGAKRISLQSALIAILLPTLVFLILFMAVCSYSGTWPPLAAVESGSMQHSEDRSSLGVLDAGDIVLIKKVSSLSEINTYVNGQADGSKSYGEFGDTVIYLEEGMEQPIIHRAICELVYNQSGGGFDIPSLSEVPYSLWTTSHGHSWWNLKDMVSLFGVGYSNVTVEIDLSKILSNMAGSPHGGLITMGDANWMPTPDGKDGQYDQALFSNVDEPITLESIIGVAKGELPWLGGLKVVLSDGNMRSVPINSQIAMISIFGIIIALPFAPEMAWLLRRRR